MQTVVQAILGLALVGAASAIGVFRLGKCPQVDSVQNFDINRYMGKWWEYERFPAIFEYGVECGFANYTLMDNGKIKVLNSGIQHIKFLWFTIKRERTNAVGEAAIVDPAQPSRLQVSFGGMPAGSGEANYFLVDTDYDNYAVVYSCSPLIPLPGLDSTSNIQFAWILTRAQGVKPANYDAIIARLTSFGVDVSPFITVDQSASACVEP